MIEEIFKDTLKKSRLFCTRERVRLFQELKNSHDPCSIAHLVSATAEAMDETTVYRNLDAFEKIGIVHRVYTGWKYKVELSDMFRDHHHHMTCTTCGNIISFEEPESLETELKKLGQKYNFSVQSHTLELKGLCSACSN